eukprot:TRINITY_DN15658_c0_g2_i1.p1 TRINITY_DN15658_c0_g2~~TRINITY_DN15658_c0_g2_i1.p1  ORF type:complete len:247 (-),score=15.96 TRINITY_DN15658_c0_g2_i1:117-857(-)
MSLRVIVIYQLSFCLLQTSFHAALRSSVKPSEGKATASNNQCNLACVDCKNNRDAAVQKFVIFGRRYSSASECAYSLIHFAPPAKGDFVPPGVPTEQRMPRGLQVKSWGAPIVGDPIPGVPKIASPIPAKNWSCHHDMLGYLTCGYFAEKNEHEERDEHEVVVTEHEERRQAKRRPWGEERREKQRNDLVKSLCRIDMNSYDRDLHDTVSADIYDLPRELPPQEAVGVCSTPPDKQRKVPQQIHWV